MEVIVLAGGLGTRLRSEIKDIPKCMAPIGDKPFLWYILKYLSDPEFEVSRVILSVGYLKEEIMNWIDKNKEEFPFEFAYAVESEPLGTGGAVKLALKECEDSDIVILNGDTYFDVNLKDFTEHHRLSPALISVALKPMKSFDRYGKVELNEDSGIISKFEEKKFCAEGLINGGSYALKREEMIKLMSNLPEKFSFEKDILEKSVIDSNVYGRKYDNYFIDIGIPEDYHIAQEILPNKYQEN